MSETVEQAQQRYLDAMHAMQTGVKMLLQVDPGDGDTGETSPKHLRVGVNSALASISATAKLLMDKGFITELEYFTALADFTEADVRSYEQRLTQYFERPVKLQ